MGNDMVVTYIGHVTFLIQTQGINILTDPVWSERVSPVSFVGPKRVTPPGVDFADLPKIDAVLISHNHYDHLDIPTIRDLVMRDQPRFIVPLGNDTIIKNSVPDAVVEAFDWEQTATITPEASVTLSPMHHWSARGPFDRNKALWAAMTIKTPGGNIYFVGDSGYGGGDYFREDLKNNGPFRFAILPIGAYEPRWFMRYGHMNPAEAVAAYQDIGRPRTAAAHYDVFQLTDEAYGQADTDHDAALAATSNPAEDKERFRRLKVGETWQVP
jgi:L-ascorbate metabolism protein UlaG (beta-lactamase superfamily)